VRQIRRAEKSKAPVGQTGFGPANEGYAIDKFMKHGRCEIWIAVVSEQN
jgi:hypothetical protein